MSINAQLRATVKVTALPHTSKPVAVNVVVKAIHALLGTK